MVDVLGTRQWVGGLDLWVIIVKGAPLTKVAMAR